MCHFHKTSSTIFDLFLDELSVRLRENCGSGIFITNDIPDIFCLMFADDVLKLILSFNSKLILLTAFVVILGWK